MHIRAVCCINEVPGKIASQPANQTLDVWPYGSLRGVDVVMNDGGDWFALDGHRTPKFSDFWTDTRTSRAIADLYPAN